MLKETNKIIMICLFVVMNIQFIPSINGQGFSFDKIKWENDKYGKFGDRVKMMEMENFQFPISEDKLNDYNLTQFTDVMGQPDLQCEYEKEKILIWYLEGYRNPEYFSHKDFEFDCDSKFPFSNSFLIYTFNNSGEFVSFSKTNEGG
jgi:hypothetical protein